MIEINYRDYCNSEFWWNLNPREDFVDISYINEQLFAQMMGWV